MFARHPGTLLIPHLRGELDAAARAEVEVHLRGCDVATPLTVYPVR